MYDLDDRRENTSSTIRAVFIIVAIIIISALVYCQLPFFAFPVLNTFLELTEVRCTMAVIGLCWVTVLILMIVLPF